MVNTPELALVTEGCAVTKTDDLAGLMRAYFSPPEWALFFEVYAMAGGGGGRTDALAMNLYPSRGLAVHGFEMKVSRADWLRELKQPAKAEEMFSYCDHWWLVVGDRSIVKDGELPGPWGLMAPRSNGNLAIFTRAPKLKPKPLDRDIVAGLARRANEMANESIQARVDAETADLHRRLGEVEQKLHDAHRLSNRRLADEVAAFEAASGISIAQGWRHGAEIGKVVKAVLEVGLLDDQRHKLNYVLQGIDDIRDRLQKLLDALPNKKVGAA